MGRMFLYLLVLYIYLSYVRVTLLLSKLTFRYILRYVRVLEFFFACSQNAYFRGLKGCFGAVGGI